MAAMLLNLACIECTICATGLAVLGTSSCSKRRDLFNTYIPIAFIDQEYGFLKMIAVDP